MGTYSDESTDYPDWGVAVGAKVAALEPSGPVKGLCVCGSGVGISIAANKIAGVRAASATCDLCAVVSPAQ